MAPLREIYCPNRVPVYHWLLRVSGDARRRVNSIKEFFRGEIAVKACSERGRMILYICNRLNIRRKNFFPGKIWNCINHLVNFTI